ncbi:ISKra4-like element ISBte2 family transposase [Paraburkholderia sp. MM6662-R1]|uniref:ISKra4-like element ISBte2 family transposase n=1 Tax=Paraburkholderia sp. MM6662-R1 TaxID=2991066 RepID=UPI003D2103E7
MKIVVRVELITDWGDTNTVEVGRIDRPSQTLDSGSVGLSLADGKQLLHSLQQAVIPAQTDEICALRRICRRCHRWTGVKGLPESQSRYRLWYRQLSQPTPRILRLRAALVFGNSVLPAMADHAGARYAGVVSPPGETRSADVVSTSGRDDAEFLPVGDKINHVTIRNRTLRVGARIDTIELPSIQPRSPTTEWTLAIDGGFVRGRGKTEIRSFEILTGRLAAPGGKPRVFACVRSELPDVAERLTSLVQTHSGTSHPRLSVITDGANGIQSIYRQLPFTATPILDWFHISMRVRHLEQIVKGLLPRSETEKYTKKALCTYANRLRWCFWHANAAKTEQRMQQTLLLCRIVVAQTARFTRSLEQLDYRVGELLAYLKSNSGSTIAYGKHYREHRPISTAMAESAVNQVINVRMCKHQHMRWTPRGAHLLAQVRCAGINGDLAAKLAAYRARIDEVPEDVARFLEFMQRAEEAKPHAF